MLQLPSNRSVDPRSDAAIRLSEQQLRFLDELAKATQPLAEPAEVMQVTARMLGEHLGVSRCAYAQVEADQDHFDLFGDYTHEVESVVGRYSFGSFGAEVLRLMRANQPYVVDDVDTDPRTAGTDLAAYRHMAIRAVICLPLHKNGRFVAAMAVHQNRPRHWRAEEIELVELVVGRCWESLERARSQGALASSNARLNLALAAGALGDWNWEAASGLVTLSRRAAEILGLPAPLQQQQQQAGPWEPISQVLTPDDRARVAQAVRHTLRTGERYADEYRLPQAQPPRWMAVWGTPERDERGRTVRILGVLQDITGRKQMEEALRDRARELGEADRRKDEFLAVLAHELRNPLAPIGLAAELLRGGRLDAAGLARTAEVIRSQVRHMSRLLEDLMDASRIRNGSLHMKKETVPLAGIVEIALQNAGPLLKSRQHALTVSALPRVQLHADPVRIAQVLSNLLTNAAKYTDVGGRVALTVRLVGDASSANDNNHARNNDDSAGGGSCEFEVRDSGIGLDEGARERIFEMFSQETSALERSEGGLGIGLALVRAIVQAHGGSVQAASDGLGCGSRFTVRLPGVMGVIPAEAGATTNAVAAGNAGDASTASDAGDAVAVDDAGDPGDAAVAGDPGAAGAAGGAADADADGDTASVVGRADTAADLAIAAAPGEPPAPARAARRAADGRVAALESASAKGLASNAALASASGLVSKAAPASAGHAASASSLPSKRASASASSAGSTPQRPPGLRILLADDNASALELLRELLSSEGHQVQCANDGAQALSLAKLFKPRVVILDIGMPKLNGYEVATALRATEWGRASERCYLIAATGWGQQADKARAAAVGFDLHLTKPFNPLALLETLSALQQGQRPQAA